MHEPRGGLILLLLTDRQETILAWVFGGAALIGVLVAFLVLVGYASITVGAILFGAYRNPLYTVVGYLVAWGILSAVVWFFEGGKDKYGWASMVAIVVGLVVGALEEL